MVAMPAQRNSPKIPSSAQRLRLRYHGRKRQFSWTIRRMRPSTRRASASASAKVGASGFWQSTGIDRAAAMSTSAAWVSRGEAMSRASTFSAASRLSSPSKAAAMPNLAGALPRPTDIGIADRHHHGAPIARPGDKVVVTDHPGPHHADPQRCLEAGSFGSHVMVHQPKRRAGLCHSTCARCCASGNHRASGSRNVP